MDASLLPSVARLNAIPSTDGIWMISTKFSEIVYRAGNNFPAGSNIQLHF